MKSFSPLAALLGNAATSLRAGWTSFTGTTPTSELETPVNEETETTFSGASWQVNTLVEKVGEGFDVRMRFQVKEGSASSVRVGVVFDFEQWSTTNYLLMPAAAYNGNRFHSVPSNEVEKFVGTPSAVMPLTITDQQRLAISPGPSRLDFRSGDLSTPAVCVHFPAKELGLVILTDQATTLGNTGLVFSENENRSGATLQFTAPAVRSGDRGLKRGDLAANFALGEAVELHLRVYLFHASTINELFEEYFLRRNDLRTVRPKHELPFSTCWDIQEDKYNRQNWVESLGYYSVGMRESPAQDWQTSWVGGMNTVYPLLSGGTEMTRQRARRTFDFLFAGGQGKAGFFREICYQGTWWPCEATLQRYSADALLFLMKEYLLLEAQGQQIPEGWKLAAHRCADAFVTIWNTQGQFGHRVDVDSGVIIYGGTCSASTACGGLALAARYFNDPRYLVVARQAAEHYHQEYISRGITNGGPGDIIQCPDSESAAGLLESFITLFEETGERRWIEYARDAAHHCATWTMTYDFVFPETSTFGRLDMLTVGTVFANIQNKHSAPGICSLSGASLFKLYRATGEALYLDLLRDIAHAIPQFMSRADRLINDIRPGQRWPVMDPGWINERVNTSDWEVRDDPVNEIGVGEIFGGSTWAEVAMMLTWVEVPGIYWQTDTNFLYTFDHVDARLICENGNMSLEITNPTKFPASVKLYHETSANLSQALGAIALHDMPRIDVAPGQTVTHVLTK